MTLDTSKREREAGELSVKREIAATQAEAASLLSVTMPKKACVGGRHHDTASTDGVMSVDNSLGFETVARKHHRVLPQQLDIHAAMTRPSRDGDLRKVNHTALTTAIADFFHAHNISDHTVESQRWLHVLQCARSVGSNYKCPNRKDIGGDLLNINALNYKKRNLDEATVDADIFGLAMLGDGATIKTMALFGLPRSSTTITDGTGQPAAGRPTAGRPSVSPPVNGGPVSALRTERLLPRTNCPAGGRGRVPARSATSHPTKYLPAVGRCNSRLAVSYATLPIPPLSVFPLAVSAGC